MSSGGFGGFGDRLTCSLSQLGLSQVQLTYNFMKDGNVVATGDQDYYIMDDYATYSCSVTYSGVTSSASNVHTIGE